MRFCLIFSPLSSKAHDVTDNKNETRKNPASFVLKLNLHKLSDLDSASGIIFFQKKTSHATRNFFLIDAQISVGKKIH